MKKMAVLALLFSFVLTRIAAQILPKDGSKLNYRLIGFSFPKQPEASKYNVEIAAGNYDTEDSFKRHIVKKIETTYNRVIA